MFGNIEKIVRNFLNFCNKCKKISRENYSFVRLEKVVPIVSYGRVKHVGSPGSLNSGL